MAWSNGPVCLYHGTLAKWAPDIISHVEVTRGRKQTDFGRGFYTTTWRTQAERWARRLAAHELELGGRNGDCRPAIVWFEVDRNALASLDSLSFVRGQHNADDYWTFVAYCRQGKEPHRPGHYPERYDVAYGPVARPPRRRRAYRQYDQVSFHTERAAGILDASPKDWVELALPSARAH